MSAKQIIEGLLEQLGEDSLEELELEVLGRMLLWLLFAAQAVATQLYNRISV